MTNAAANRGWWFAVRRWLFGRNAWRPASALGVRAEDEAVRHLRGLGYTILDRNVRVTMGEADVVVRDPAGAIAVVEVKSRVLEPGVEHPPPEAAVTRDKRRRLVRILRHLARANQWSGPLRIDVVAIDWTDDRPAAVRHYVDAVR
ncbi:MAG: YraN family protein [Phycisphaerales bacterium]